MNGLHLRKTRKHISQYTFQNGWCCCVKCIWTIFGAGRRDRNRVPLDGEVDFQSTEAFLGNSNKSLSTQEAHPPSPIAPAPPPPLFPQPFPLCSSEKPVFLWRNNTFLLSVIYTLLWRSQWQLLSWEHALKDREWGYCGSLTGVGSWWGS